MTANLIDFLDPATRAARELSLELFDMLPRPVRIAVWESVTDVIGVELAQRFVALGHDGYSEDAAARILVGDIRSRDRDAVERMHVEMLRRGFRGSLHVLAYASILRDAARPPRRTRRWNRLHNGPITFRPETTSRR